MKRIGAVLFCLLIAVSATAIEIDEAKFNLGNKFYLEKNYQSALMEFDSLIARYPSSVYAKKSLYLAAKSAFSIQLYEKAEIYYYQLGEKSTAVVDQRQALFGEAECNYRLKRWEKSASLFLDFALKFSESPVASSALYYAAKSSEFLGMTVDSKSLYFRIVTKYPGSPYYQEAWRQVGDLADIPAEQKPNFQKMGTNQSKDIGFSSEEGKVITNFIVVTNNVFSSGFSAAFGSNQITNLEQLSNFIITSASNCYEDSNTILLDQAMKESQRRQDEVDRYRSLLELKSKLLEMKEQAIRDKNNLIVNTNELKGMP